MKCRSWTDFLTLADDTVQLDEALVQEANYDDPNLRRRIGEWMQQQEAVAADVRTALRWEDIASASTILPEHEAAAHLLIEKRLGYLPGGATRLRHEPFLRALLQQYVTDQIDYDSFSPQADETIKLIRNGDMAVHRCASCRSGVYRNYQTYLPDYRSAAHERLSGFLGYAPQRQHALVAELWLRQLLAKDLIHLPEQETEVDRRAMTVVKFREALTERDLAAANASPLWYSC